MEKLDAVGGARLPGARETNQRLTTEAHVQQTVREFLEADGWRAIRTDPVSDRARGKGFGEVGMPDYLFVRYTCDRRGAAYKVVSLKTQIWMEVAAQVLWIEFKRAGQKPKPRQARWIEAERARGALVIVVDDIDAFIVWYKASGLNRRMR